MRQLTFTASGRLRWEQTRDLTLVEPGDAIVRPVAASRCDLDRLLLVQGFGKQLRWGMRLGLIDPCVCQHFGARPFAGPYPFGHECVARIEACGPEVTRFVPGQLVVVPFSISCGTCARCKLGLTGLCAAVPSLSAYGMGLGWGGVLADQVRVPFADAMLVPVPDGVDPAAVVSAADNLSDAWRLIAPALEQRPGADVLVVGGRCASIGLYAAAIARALGAAEVDYMDTDRGRLEIAQRLGARPIEQPPRKPGRQYTVVVDATASRRGLRFGLGSTGTAGMFASAGIYFFKQTGVPLFSMYARGIGFVTGLPNARADMPKVLELVRAGRLHPELVTTHVADWEAADEAFLEPSAKVVVTRR